MSKFVNIPIMYPNSLKSPQAKSLARLFTALKSPHRVDEILQEVL